MVDVLDVLDVLVKVCDHDIKYELKSVYRNMVRFRHHERLLIRRNRLICHGAEAMYHSDRFHNHMMYLTMLSHPEARRETER